MTNSLIKDTTLETVAGTEEVPAQPYIAPTPARTVHETRNVCKMRYAVPGHYEYVTDTTTGVVSGVFVPDNPQPGVQLIGTWVCANELVPVTYPADPGQPFVPGYSVAALQVVEGYNLGWNAGGRSIAFFTADGSAEFKARINIIGAIVGLNVDDGTPVTYNGNTINYGFLLARGVAKIIQNGVVGASVGTYTESTVFKIQRTGTAISYKMAGVEVATATGAPTTATWLEAALYSGTDEIFDPVLTQTSAPDLTAGTGTLAATLAPLAMQAADYEYSVLNAILEPLAMLASAGEPTPSYGILAGNLAPFSFAGNMLTGEKGQISAVLEPLKMLAADHPYGEMFLTLPPLTADMSAYEGNTNATMGSMAFMGSTMSPESFLVATMRSDGTWSASMVPNALVDADMLSSANAGSTMAANAIVQAIMVSIGQSGTTLGVPDSDSETWVINLATRGTTTYTNFGFNSFAQIGGKFYGAGPQGIVALEGDTDNGLPIAASISLGELDFGTALKKTVSHCYVGMAGEGPLYVKLVVEGVEYLYKAESFSERLRQHRVKFGKGLRENYITVEIHNVDGNDFEVDTVEFHLADLTRRI